jgi:hypothetical protein
VIDAYTDGSLLQVLKYAKKARNFVDGPAPEEAAVLVLLNRKLVIGNERRSGSNLRKQLKQSLRSSLENCG